MWRLIDRMWRLIDLLTRYAMRMRICVQLSTTEGIIPLKKNKNFPFPFSFCLMAFDEEMTASACYDNLTNHNPVAELVKP